MVAGRSDAMVDQVRAIQASMVEAGSRIFAGPELDGMRCLIRLTVEFHHFLRGDAVVAAFIDDKVGYICESVFSGVDSFALMGHAYGALPGARPTTLAAGAKSAESVREEFLAKYIEFASAEDFDLRCRLLLDLFKLQLVFAALSYG